MVTKRCTEITTLQTVGDVLVARNIPLYVGDEISYDLSEPLQPNMAITIKRATPTTIYVDGKVIQTRSRLDTVGQLLAYQGISLIWARLYHSFRELDA